METQKSNNLILTERNRYHEKLMVSILQNLAETPLTLKGGGAVYLGYGLNCFSEDLDCDLSKKLNLLGKIKSSSPQGIIIDEINVQKRY
ncbi:MAG: hypothetical protein GKC53_03970 [Neisseriaceae bacterium]|nr:MAG: hypothetical protein GKC53_03970 [Neisseriaceae bacterium]